MGRVERDRGRDGLQAAVDAADDVGQRGGARGGDARGGHGGWGHGGVHACGDDAAAVVEGPDAGDAVGAVIEGWAERGGERGHVVRREGGVGGAEGFFEDVQGSRDGEPFVVSGRGGRFEVHVRGWDVRARDRGVASVGRYCVAGYWRV